MYDIRYRHGKSYLMFPEEPGNAKPASVRRSPVTYAFVIARGSRSEAKVVVVEIEEDGVKGVGECTPYPRYGESIASVMAQILTIGEQLESGITREQLQHLLPVGQRNAVDCALWDLQARRVGKTIPQLLGIGLPNRVVTAQTVVIGTLNRWPSAAALWEKGPATEGETG